MAERNVLSRAWQWLTVGPDTRQTRGADPLLPWGSSYIPTNGQVGLPAAGIQITDDQALAITSVYTAVSILADSVATLPLVEYKRGRRADGPVSNPSDLTVNPWPEGTLQDWITQVMVSLTLRGNFFGKITDRDPRGFPTVIQPIHPDMVYARRDQDGKRLYWISGTRVPTENVVHIPNILVPGSFVGLNPVEYMRGSFGLAAAAERYMGGFYANSATPTGVIEVGEDLTEEETLELARAWKMSHAGVGNAGLPAVLTGGATWKSISVSPGDAQFIASRDFQRQEIASFFRIPAHLMGQQDRTSSWGSGVEQMELGFVINTLRPYLSKLESYFTRLLPLNREARFDLRGRLRGDEGQRYANYALAINNGWLSPDEARALEDLPPLPNGDGSHYWRPLNFAPIDKVMSGEITPGGGGAGGGIGDGVNVTPMPSAPTGTQPTVGPQDDPTP